MLYVSPDRKQWYLTIHGLEPCPEGRVYQAWFAAEGGPVSAGTFEVVAGQPVELERHDMPQNTEAIFVTLEPQGGVTEPTGPRILYGDEAMLIL